MNHNPNRPTVRGVQQAIDRMNAGARKHEKTTRKPKRIRRRIKQLKREQNHAV